MSSELTTTDEIPEPRSLTDIEDQLDAARALQVGAANRLRAARSTFGNAVGGGSSEAYLASVQNEHLPELRAVEQDLVESLDRHLADLATDRQVLTTSAWRPDPAITSDPTWNTQLIVAQSQLDSLPPDVLLATLEGAVLHRDRVQAAAFATLASRLTSRDLPTWERASLQGALSQCRALSGEQSVQRLIADLDAARNELQDLRTEIVTVANAVEPGSIGNILDRFQFGTTLGARPASLLDRPSLFRRAGVGPAS